MRRDVLLSILLAATAVLLVGVSGASAATDVRVVRDDVRVAYATGLDDTIVYDRFGRHTPKHPWIRVIDGRRHNATLPGRNAVQAVESLGRDRHGRLVMPYMTGRWTKTKLVDRRWWLYDVRRNRSRPLEGLPTGGCTPAHVAIWRTWLAFQRPTCGSGIYLRRGGRTRRVSRIPVYDAQAPLALRGRNLATISGSGDSTFSVWQLVVDGRVCPAAVPESTSDADSGFAPGAVWLNGDRVSWTMGGDLVLETTLHRDCTPPDPPGAYPDLAYRAIVLDGTTLYSTDGRTIYRRDMSEGPSTAPPPNASVATAQSLAGTVPETVTARIGTATPAPGDPPVHPAGQPARRATGALWYAFRPDTARTVTVNGGGGPYGNPYLNYGSVTVYEDMGAGTLTELPATTDNFDEDATTFAADPARQYLIGIGCDNAGPCWPTFTLKINPSASAAAAAARRR